MDYEIITKIREIKALWYKYYKGIKKAKPHKKQNESLRQHDVTPYHNLQYEQMWMAQ